MPSNTDKPEMVTFRASPALRGRLEELAQSHGGNRSKAIQAAILNATQRETTDIPDEQEILELLGESARAGNVTAMKELRVYHRERDSDETEEAPLAAVDELAQRRAS